MIKEIELYKGKKIVVDFVKVKKHIFDVFTIFLFIIYPLIINYRSGLGTISLKHIIFMVITGVTFLVLISIKILEGKLKVTKYYILLGLYFLLICVSATVSEYGNDTVLGKGGRGEGVIPIFCYLICFYIFFETFKPNEKIFEFITASIVVLTCYGILQSLLFDTFSFFGRYGNMGYSNFGNPNMFSSYLNLFFPIYLVKYFYNNNEMKLNICVLGIIFAGIICSKTFGGYITSAICFIVLSVFFIIINKFNKNILMKVIKVCITFFAILVVLNICNNNTYFGEITVNKTQISQIINTNSDNNSNSSNNSSNNSVDKFGSGRGFIWKMSLDVISKHPLFGVGPDSLGSEVRKYYMDRDDYMLDDTLADKAHNEYLQIAATTGIPSLAIYLIFVFTILISLLLKYIKYAKEGKVLEENTMNLVAISSSIVSYLIQAFGNISVISVAPLFWSMLGIGAKIASYEEK